MSPTHWILYSALTALLAGLALLLYARREPGGRARLIAGALRAGALALALLLAFDPWMRGLASGPRGESLVLLDDSWSMRLPAGAADGTRWEVARSEVASLSAGRVTLLSGRSIDVEDLGGLRPSGSESRIVPALRAALEGGVRRVVVVSDGGVTDLEEASRLVASAGASVRVIAVGAPDVANAAVAAVDAPRSAPAGQTVSVRVDVAALGMEGDSLSVVLERGAEVIARAPLRAPADGRLASVQLQLDVPASAAGSSLVLHARVLTGGAGRTGAGQATARADRFPEDDARPVLIDIEERPRGIVLVSLIPDWEPRFLLPVLERSSGLPVRGYIRTPAGDWLTLGTGAAAARRVTESVVRTDLESAFVAVLHGVGGAGPGWVRDRLSHPRLIVFPAAATEARGLPAPLDAAAAAPVDAGDWYVDPEPRASPVAALLSSLPLRDLPPLTSLRAGATPPGSWAPLAARRDRRGSPHPVAVAGASGSRRWVVATGTGYWRWALRGGDSRRAYGLFWSSLVGWLTEDMDAGEVAAVRPESRVVERGQSIVWHVAGDADSLRLRIGAADAITDTVVAIGADRTARTAALEPGIAPWSATAGDLRESGELAIAAWSPEFVRGARDLALLSSSGATFTSGVEGRRRLHSQAWPWILLVALLCGEWIARRRLGLR